MDLKNTKNYLLLMIFGFLTVSCSDPETYKQASKDPQLVHDAVQQLTNTIVHDIFSPPVASRIYAYPSIAAYEALRQDYPEYRTLAGQLSELEAYPQPDPDKAYCFPLASLEAFSRVGKELIFSEGQIEEYRKKMYAHFEDMNMPSEIYENSIEYGRSVAAHTLSWADNDNYKQTRSSPKYSVLDIEGRWKPTPPAYMEGIEPHWNKIRPFVIDSAAQFRPVPPTPYSLDKQSGFYKELMEVYEVRQNLTEEQEAIAKFWDCNPYVSHHRGHVMFATKKITPGGHWMGIAKLASQANGDNQMESLRGYAAVAITLADGFISCWDEKYRSSLIRPETVINKHIDHDWKPLLQTPPFPEYTSGHSVISTAAALALTDIYGEGFKFVDISEEAYGLPSRSYSSFMEASQEAAISRLYGGIHYRPAIEVGVEQGKKVGSFVMENLEFKTTGVAEN